MGIVVTRSQLRFRCMRKLAAQIHIQFTFGSDIEKLGNLPIILLHQFLTIEQLSQRHSFLFLPVIFLICAISHTMPVMSVILIVLSILRK